MNLNQPGAVEEFDQADRSDQTDNPGQTDQTVRRTVLAELRTWPPRRWAAALLGALATVVLVAVPTDLIDTPWFVRDVPPTWWAWPVLIANAVLAGMVGATYVARKDTAKRSGGTWGVAGGLVTFFAVGCPVCNKLVLLALGYAGALQFFEPLQPYLAGSAIALLAIALVMRIRRERTCPLPKRGALSARR